MSVPHMAYTAIKEPFVGEISGYIPSGITFLIRDCCLFSSFPAKSMKGGSSCSLLCHPVRSQGRVAAGWLCTLLS